MSIDSSSSLPPDVIPVCDINLKPYVGQFFPSEEDGVKFYRDYAKVCGFDIRLGQRKPSYDGKTTILRYVLCNREGDKNPSGEGVKSIGGEADVENENLSAVKKKRRISIRTGCLARVDLKYAGKQGFYVKCFVENHNHPMLSDESKSFQRSGRNMDFAQQEFVMDCARACIGPMKSFRLFKEVMGSFASVGSTSTDFKNYSRDHKAFVEGADAQMVIKMLNSKNRACPAFTFYYHVDSKDKLCRLFWVDPICKHNFSIFGDIVSFDATYSTNRYNMIFAPFTGKDNHGRCITFAACLISNEDAESYSWVLEKFKECMGRCPAVIVTDQDLGMKVAVERVFVGSRHRNCMWHIMLKVPDKVPHDLKKNEDFMKKLCRIVWSEEIEPAEFEVGWHEIMNEYRFVGNKWFDSMFECRQFWIPAYFRDMQFSGLVKTTSVSESENHAFQSYLKPRFNLLEFFMNFDSALGSQRYLVGNLNYLDEISKHDMQTTLRIEAHAACIYTAKMFRFVQKEIVTACFDCRINHIGSVGCIQEYRVLDEFDQLKIVTHNSADGTTVCSCKLFIRVGVLCCHSFLVLRNLKVDQIPEKYIVDRWRKNAHLKAINPLDRDAALSFATQDQSKINSGKLITEFYNCVGLVDGKCDMQEELLRDISALKVKYTTTGSSTAKEKSFESFYGGTVPDDIVIKPPNPVKTKGSGSRLVSRREKAVLVAKKPLRMCSKCKQMANHDKRNCKVVCSSSDESADSE